MKGEITIVPVGTESPSMRSYVEGAIAAIRRTGMPTSVTEMGTNVEGSLDEILRAFGAAHEACVARGAPRVLALLRIDDRRDGVHGPATRVEPEPAREPGR